MEDVARWGDGVVGIKWAGWESRLLHRPGTKHRKVAHAPDLCRSSPILQMIHARGEVSRTGEQMHDHEVSTDDTKIYNECE